MTDKKVLFVLTSHEELGNTGQKTGFWIEEFAAPYYLLTDKGVNVTLSSPKGGQPPIDPKSSLPDFSTPATERFNTDSKTKEILSNTFHKWKGESSQIDDVLVMGIEI